MITERAYLMGRDYEYPLSDKLKDNMLILLHRVNSLLNDLKIENVIVTSGYRPGHYNQKANGASKSAHTLCKGIDILDDDGQLKKLINEEILEKHNLWMEHPGYTPSWVHLDTKPRKNRIFRPY